MLRLKLAEKGVKVDDRRSVLDTDVGPTGAGHSVSIDGDQYGIQVDREEGGHLMKLKKKIGSMKQLVTQMLLQRNNTSCSIINQKLPVQSHLKLLLSCRAVSVEDPDGVMELDDEDNWGLELCLWLIQ